MANPYGTPVFPRVPNSTPASHKRIPRAPIINPYDKFTQPEFDAWINDITGALKRALGREELPEVPGRTPGVSGRSVEAEYEHDDEDAVEDSFAEVKARRTAKGKQRGTEEGTEAQPVIILSDSEEEAGPEDEEWGEGWSGLANTDHHENGDEADEYTGSEASDEQEEGSSDAPAEVIELLSDSDESEEQVVGGDVTPLHATGETSDEEVDALEDNSPDPEHVYSVAAVVVKLPQMNDIEVQDIEQNEETEGFPPVKTSTSSVDLPDPWDGPRTYAEDFYSGGDIPESSVREANAHILPTEVNSAKDNISIETRIREDIKGATTVLMPPGDNTEDGEELPEEEHDEEEEPDEDEALEFADDEPEEIIDLTEEEHLEPVHARAAAENELDNANRLVTNEMYGMKEQDFSLGDIDQRPIEVPDPWNGPRTFAEDFYAGGELRDIHRLKGQLSPSRLTPDERPSFEFNGDRPSGSVDDCIAAPLPEFAESSPRMSAERTAMQLNDDSDILKGLYADLDNTDLMQADLMNTDMLPQELWDEAVMSSQEGIGAMPTEHAPLTPPRPSLRTHVDWNWPPAFSGRFATGPGHLGMDGGHAEAVHEVFEISDDDEEDEESAEPVGDIHADELVKVDQEEVGTEVNGGPDEETSGVAVRTQIVPYPGESVDTAVVDGSSDLAVGEAATDVEGVALILSDHNEATERTDSWNIVSGDTEAKTVSTGVQQPGAVGTTGGSSDAIRDSDTQMTAPPTTKAAAGEVIDGGTLDGDGEEIIQGIVVEVSDVEDHDSLIVVTDYQDVVSVEDNGAAETLEYEVEEPVTEGRRTEEPERATPSSIDDGTGLASADQLDIAGLIAEDDGQNRREDTADILQDTPAGADAVLVSSTSLETETAVKFVNDHTVELLTAEVGSAEDIIELPRTKQSSAPVSPTFADVPIISTCVADVVDGFALTAEDQSLELQYPIDYDDVEPDSMLSTGVPMPVSADPTVPDPTSVAHTPVSSSSPSTEHDSFARSVSRPAEEVPSESSRANPATYSRSASGLFTPRAFEDSMPSTPDIGTIEIGDIAQAVYHEDTIEAKQPPLSDATPTASPVEESASVVPLGAAQEDTNLIPRRLDLDTPENWLIERHPSDQAKTHPSVETPHIQPAIETPPPSGTKLSLPSADTSLRNEHVDDTDAEGDVDPDYVAKNTEVTSLEADRVSEVRGTELKTADKPSSPVVTSVNDISSAIIGSPEADPTIEESGELSRQEPEAGLSAPNVGRSANTEDPRPESNLRASKRKRELSPMLPPRLRRTLSTRAPAQDDLPSSRVADGIGARKGKSKQDYGDVLENTPESTGDQPQSDSIPTSGATIESRLLTRRSRTNSRASSVASSSSQHSASSRLTHPSPTLRKNAPLPLVFTHSHGVLHHHHGRPRPSHSHLEQRGRSPASTTMEPGPSRPNPDTSSLLSSPVTRSHCRFHKVSIPREEDGPRIYFVIPGCSLGDAELMKEEEIIDHGPATMEDHARLISDIDDLALDPYVVAAMRQLAGVDLLREGELYYLPQAGEDIRWKGESKWQVVKGKVENMDSASARHKLEPTSSRILKTSHHAASRAPPSRTESTSSSISTQQTSRLSTNASVSGSELSDLEDDEPASRKHRRLDDPAPTVNDEASTSEVLSKSSNAASHRLKSRNRKQLSTEASAYNPERDESDDSDDDRIAEVKRKRRGVKRGRTINAVEEQPESISHVLKKRKVRPLDTQ